MNTGDLSLLQCIPSVVADSVAVGRLAARHLVETGRNVVACHRAPANWGAAERGRGFLDEARALGAGASELPAWGGAGTAVGWDEALADLPAGSGLFCTSDYLARAAVQRLVRGGRRVPEDVAVVGAGDSALDGLLAGMGLSSVVLPAHAIGRRAAAVLARLLAGEAVPPTCERVAPERVVVRASSALPVRRDPVVARAQAFIEQNLDRRVRVAALARAAGASRRTLELRFRAVVGRSPAAELRERRLALAERLLVGTDLTVSEVAARCGFAGPHHLVALFRRLRGTTPGAYRRVSLGASAGMGASKRKPKRSSSSACRSATRRSVSAS